MVRKHVDEVSKQAGGAIGVVKGGSSQCELRFELLASDTNCGTLAVNASGDGKVVWCSGQHRINRGGRGYPGGLEGIHVK